MAEEEKKATTTANKFSASLSAVEGDADGDVGWGSEGDWGWGRGGMIICAYASILEFI